MVLLMARDGYYMAYAIGADLTAWGNAWVALELTEINALDWFHSANITHTKPRTISINPMTASHYPKRLEVGKILGRLSTTHYLQTGILSYAAMGACTTSANGAEVTSVTCIAGSLITAADYFFINCVDGAGATVNNYVWFTVDAAGDDPTPGGTGIGACAILSTDTAAEVAGKLKTTMDAGNYGASAATSVVTITNANNGAVDDAVDGNTDFIISTTTQGSSKHATTKDTDEAPIWLAFHYEKEGTSANRRKDCEGIIPRYLDITVSQNAPIAMQTYTAEFANSVAGANLAQPTAHKQANLEPYYWYDYKNTDGGSLFQYNGGEIDVDIVDLKMRIGWAKAKFGTYVGAYPTNGLVVPPFDSYVELGVDLKDYTDTALDTIADLAHGSYAGNLNFVADFYKSAIHYLKYTWTDMYVDPESYEEVFQAEGEWFDGVRFTLRFRDETSTLTKEEINSIDKTYYENP